MSGRHWINVFIQDYLPFVIFIFTNFHIFLLNHKSIFRLPHEYFYFFKAIINWGAYSRWSFHRNSLWGSIGTKTTRKRHSTLVGVDLNSFFGNQSYIQMFQKFFGATKTINIHSKRVVAKRHPSLLQWNSQNIDLQLPVRLFFEFLEFGRLHARCRGDYCHRESSN